MNVGLVDLSQAMAWLIRGGVLFRLIFCFTRMMGDENDLPMYKKRALHAVVFLIISECVWQIENIVFYYYH